MGGVVDESHQKQMCLRKLGTLYNLMRGQHMHSPTNEFLSVERAGSRVYVELRHHWGLFVLRAA